MMSNTYKKFMNIDFEEMTLKELESAQQTIMMHRRRKGSGIMKSLKIGDKVVVRTGRKTHRGKVPPKMAGYIKEVKRSRVLVDCGQYGSWTVPNTNLEV
jgi:hypothetical protein